MNTWFVNSPKVWVTVYSVTTLWHKCVSIVIIFLIQFLSQDIVQALEDPNGTEVLFALLESGANVTLPTKVSSPHI